MNQQVFECSNCGQSLAVPHVHERCPSCALQLLRLGLLEQSDRKTDLRVPATLSTQGDDNATASAQTLMAGEGVISKFGDYELLYEIARGGMGAVYRARQLSLQRDVAVKLILAGQFATPESVRRFRREAEAAARLRHPGIVRVYDIGEYESQHYFSMEFINGASLAECIEEFRLAPQLKRSERLERERTIADLISKVARALDFAHQHGVLHRDLKPSNILLDEYGQPHLSDFGLAKFSGAEMVGLTVTNAVLGTPGYLAPEQVSGNPDLVTTATDVYGVGATLYELLTGQPPFAGSSALETMWMAVHEEAKSPRSINSAVSKDLETITLRCLEKQPEQRYSSAAMVADELQRFLRNEPIEARPVSRAEFLARWCKRNPKVAALLGTVLLTFLVGSFVSLWQWNRAERANAILTESVEHLEWNAIDAMLEQGESSRALATVASLLRRSPGDRKAAAFALSLLEQNIFPLPAAPPIQHPRGADINIARLSPDAKLIVTASLDGSARIWDATESTQIGPPLEHGESVSWAEFHPHKRLVATCSASGAIRLWDTATGKLASPHYDLNEAIEKVQYSQDGRDLLVQAQHRIVLLDGETLQERFPPLTHKGLIVGAQFISNDTAFLACERNGEKSEVVVRGVDGSVIASARTGPMQHADVSQDLSHIAVVDNRGSAWIADFPTLDNRHYLPGDMLDLDSIKFDPTGESVCTVSLSQWARVWSTRSGLPVTKKLPHYYLVAGVSFTDSGRRLITWGDDALVQYWDVLSGDRVCEPLRHSNRVAHAEHRRFESNDFILATLSHGRRDLAKPTGAVQLWSIQPSRKSNVRILGTDSNAFNACSYSLDGQLVALGNTSQEVSVCDASDGKLICGPLPVKGHAWGLHFSRDGSRLFATTSKGQVTSFSIPSGKTVSEASHPPATIQSTLLSPDKSVLATSSTDGFVRVWDTETLQLRQELKHGAGINSLAFSPDGRRLASAGEDRIVCVWDVPTGALVTHLDGHINEVMKVAYSPDGRYLATASLDFTACLWDASRATVLYRLSHQGEVLDTCFSPDGRWLATGSRDRTAVIWDAVSGKPVVNGLLHHQSVRNVEFSPDGKKLLTSSFDGLRLWDSQSGFPLSASMPHQIVGGTGFQSNCNLFSPDGTTILQGSDAYEAIIWRFPDPKEDVPPWFPELLEAVARQRITVETLRPETIGPHRFLQIAAQIRSSDAVDFYTTWAKLWIE